MRARAVLLLLLASRGAGVPVLWPATPRLLGCALLQWCSCRALVTALGALSPLQKTEALAVMYMVRPSNAVRHLKLTFMHSALMPCNILAIVRVRDRHAAIKRPVDYVAIIDIYTVRYSRGRLDGLISAFSARSPSAADFTRLQRTALASRHCDTLPDDTICCQACIRKQTPRKTPPVTSDRTQQQ